uniref:Solute carrier family 12 member 2 n=1 Tax=Syphacia muris TaxID=451379 RepID=A0A0N5AW68_9BILA
MKSWRHIQTLEHPPMIDFYRDSIDAIGLNSRPSMNQLIHGEKEIFDGLISGQLEKFKPPASVPRTKFGWVQGVFVRCLLNIFGVMLYLRVSWVAGEAGILLGSLVVLLASTVTTLTAISTCAICTNGDVKGGGAYFLISRSLGPEFGGSIGMLFAFANAVGAAMYIVGFAETVRDLLVEYNVQIIDGDMNDVRIVGIVTCAILIAVVFVGTSFESKMQIGLLVILTASIVDYFIGSFLPASKSQLLKGITGYSFLTMKSNLAPSFTPGETFFSVFAVYFPAATGIMAGANISGDLADPQKAIPLGTLLAIAVTTVIYLAVVIMTGSTCVRYATGDTIPSFSLNGSFEQPDCAFNQTCKYGLMSYYQVMESESLWGPLITAGIFAATLSSALASLVSAPKVFQAVCKDRLFPKIDVFAKGYGRNEEPRRAYALAFVIALVMILIGRLNDIAPIISNFFLASYALINYACFDASFANSPGFRPRFQHYNKWLSLTGAVLCISVMFIISWSTALLTFFIFAVIFMYILHRKPDVNWGSSTQAHSYKSALQAMIKLSNTEEHVKNYRPQILVLTGNPASRPSLVDFVYSISKGSSLMICGYVVPYEPCDRVFSVVRKLDRQLNDWLKKRHIKSFYVSVANPSLRVGAENLIQISGLGKLRPNILILGFKTNWTAKGTSGLDAINDYFGVIQDAFENNMGVGVLRNVGGGLDYSELMKTHNMTGGTNLNFADVEQQMNDSTEKTYNLFRSRRPTAAQRELIASISRFQRKIKRGVIDVWWLYDDGGLTLLLPHLLTNEKSYLENARLRVFTIATSHKSMEQEQRSMAALLSKFRIDFSDVSVIPDIGRKPSPQTDEDTPEGLITDSELISQKEKTNRQLRTAELLRQHSTEADLVVLTLPVPRKGLVSSCLYMAWLDVMTRDLPPTLLIRGNQTSVLTFYS